MTYPSESFERYIVPALFAPWAARLVEVAEPQRGERVLDVACGTGIVARRVLPMVGAGGSVAGLDFNPNMIRVARQAAATEGLFIDFREGRAEDLPFSDESFDLVTCQFGLMLFGDKAAALKEMRRVLRLGGRLVLSVWQGIERHPFYRTIHEVNMRRLGTSGIGDVYALADVNLLGSLLVNAGFQQVKIDPASIRVRIAEFEEFLAWELGVDQASIPSMKDLDAPAWRVVMDEVRQDMQPAVDAAMQDAALVLDFHANIAQVFRV